MNVARWIGFLGAGVVLGSCTGYSSLGELSNAGGEDGQADGMGGSQSMGAKAGQGHGGTHTMGGAQGMGATPGMVGGSNGMGAVGGDGMGAAGGGTMPSLCMTVGDCPAAPPSCEVCADGTTTCLEPFCSNSVCGVYQPSCQDGPDSGRCMVAEDCPPAPCPREEDVAAPCPERVCVDGQCGLTLPGAEPACAKLVCGDPCMAPDGTSGACNEAGECTQNQPSCSGAEPACAKIVCGDPCMAPDGTVGTCDEAGECSGRMPVCGPAPMQ